MTPIPIFVTKAPSEAYANATSGKTACQAFLVICFSSLPKKKIVASGDVLCQTLGSVVFNTGPDFSEYVDAQLLGRVRAKTGYFQVATGPAGGENLQIGQSEFSIQWCTAGFNVLNTIERDSRYRSPNQAFAKQDVLVSQNVSTARDR